MRARRSHSWAACTPPPCLVQHHQRRHRLPLCTKVLCSWHPCSQARDTLVAHACSHTLLELGIRCVRHDHTAQHPRRRLEHGWGPCLDVAAQSLPPCGQREEHAAQARLAQWHGVWAHAVCAWQPQARGASHMLQDGLPLQAVVTCEGEESASYHGQSVLIYRALVA